MKLSHFLFVIYAGLVISSFMILVFGDKGLAEHYKLAGHQKVLAANIEAMKEKNRRLNQKLEHLSSNPEAIRLLARELGYFYPDEFVIQTDYYESAGEAYDVGVIMRLERPVGKKNFQFRLIGFMISTTILIIYFIFRKLRNYGNKADKPPVPGEGLKYFAKKWNSHIKM